MIVTNGKITLVTRKTKVISVQVDNTHGLSPGDTVKVERVLTDEQLGEKFRKLLTPPPREEGWEENIIDLANAMDGEGWEALGDLIREVGL